MALHMNSTSEFEEEAPRPIDASSVAKGGFDRLAEGQGAVSASAKRSGGETHAHPDKDPQHMSKRTLALIGASALVVIVIAVVLFVRVLDAPGSLQDEQVELEQTAVAVDESITSHGVSYELAQNGDVYQLVEVREGSQSTSLGDLPGVPVNLVLYDGAIIVPENLSDGTWDVMSYTIGSGWSQIANQEGNAITGEGVITDAQLEGSTVVLTSEGGRIEVPLVW